MADLSYVPTEVWTHGNVRSATITRLICTLIYGFTTFNACVVCGIIVTFNLLWLPGIYATRYFASHNMIRRVEELTEWAIGWPLDFGAHVIIRICHSLGVWPITILGVMPRETMNHTEWEKWSKENTRIAPDGMKEVFLPVDKSGNMRFVGGCMIVSNHMSNIDGFVLKAVLFPVISKAVIKSAAIKAPVVGPILWATRQCFVRGSRTDNRQCDLLPLYLRCDEVIRNNVALLCYPEGTRRMFGRMNPFKLGLIGAALEHEWPILVSVIHGSHRAWPPRELFVNRHPIYLKFAQKMLIPRKGHDTAESLATAIRKRMLKLMDGIPGYDEELERPLLKITDLKLITEMAKQKNKIRDSFLN